MRLSSQPPSRLEVIEESATQQAAPVGDRTARGAFWSIGAALLNKVVAFACQIALAWYLLPQDMGLVAMAVSITSMVVLVSGMNLKNVLIQRKEYFEQDAGQVFWLSLVMGAVGSIFLLIAAPIAGRIFNDNRVVPLVLLISISNFLGSAPAVYAAVLSRDLRFRAIAAMNLVSGLINNLAAVALAALGFGPYSLILPLIASSAVALLAHRFCAGRVAIPRPNPSSWKSLLQPAGLLMLNSLLTALFGFGANLVIGIQHSATVAGYYFWGFSIAMQAVFLLASNLQGVLFPALTKLNAEPTRQLEAFRKACSVLLAATVPICALQVLLAAPAIKLVFQDRWLPAAGVVQGLSIGLMTQAVSVVASSLLMAHGAFGTLCRLTGLSAVLTLTAAAIAGYAGDQTTVAFAVGGVMLVMNLVLGWRAMALFQAGWKSLFQVVRLPLALGIVGYCSGSFLLKALGNIKPLYQIFGTAPLVLAISVVGTLTLQHEVRSVFEYCLLRRRAGGG